MLSSLRDRSWARVCVLLASTAALAVATPASSSAATTTSVAAFNRFDYGDAVNSTDTTQYEFIDLGYGSSSASQATVKSLISTIHATQPNVKVLLYKAALARPTDSTGIGACVPWNSSLPYGGVPISWFLRNSSGTPIYNSKYNFYWLDQANPSVQQACLNSAVSLAKASGFDGIFLDNVSGSLYWAQITPCTGGTPTCQNNANWQSGMESYLRYEAAGLHAQGLFAFANVSGGALTYGGAGPAIWDAYLQTGIDGSMEESFSSGTNGLPVGITQWKQELLNEAWSEANGKYLLANADVFSSETLNTYGLATVMLAGQGRASWDTASGSYGGGDYIFPEYSTAQQLGAPSGPYTLLSNGVYKRVFAKGVVLVNPTTTSIPAFSLGGGTYTGTNLTHVSSVSMAPNSADILLADAAVSSSGSGSAPANTGVPVISGSAWKGQMLNVSTGSWSGSPTPTYAYQWSRCTTTSATSCTPISGASSAGYAVQAADVGYYLEATVTASNSAGVASAASAETAIVPTPTFSLSASPTSASVKHGHTASFALSVNPKYGWTGSVALSVAGTPPGSSASFSPSTTSSSSTLSVTTGGSSGGTWPLTVTGTSGSQAASVKLSLTVK